MGFIKVVKNSVGRGFSFKKWLLYDHLQKDAKFVGKAYHKVFESTAAADAKKTDSKSAPLSFEDCMRRYSLTEKDVQFRLKRAFNMARIFLICAIAMFGYVIYLFYCGFYMGGFAAIMLTLLLLSYSFREHFQYFQYTQRRLQTTLKEWYRFTFRSNR